MNYLFADRAQNVPSSGIGLLMRYAAKYDDVVSLGQGTPLFPTPQFIYDAIHERSLTDPELGQYSGAKLEHQLTELIATDMEKLYGFRPEPDELCLTVGGVGGLMSAFLSILNPGDEIIYFDPSYPIHLSQLALVQAKVVFVSFLEDQGWRLDIAKMQQSVTSKTRAVLLTNPNNPTGTVLTRDEVQAVADLVLKHDLYLVLDEAYHFLSYEELFSPLQLPELRDHIILVKSFSKEFAMTGWRIGYVYANKEIIKKLSFNVSTYLCISPPTISMAAAQIALSDPRGNEAMKGFYQEFQKSRETICDKMSALPKLFSFHKPEGAYYLFPKLEAFPELTATEFCMKLVDEAKVITIPGDSSGPAGKRHIRMSFAAKSDLIESAFERITGFAAKNNLL
jgi:aminotransferase